MNYYVFVLYIFALVCLAMLMGRALFGNLRKQRRMLEEKEQKLLTLYKNLEEGLDEFYATAEATRQELGASMKGTIEQLDAFRIAMAELERAEAPQTGGRPRAVEKPAEPQEPVPTGEEAPEAVTPPAPKRAAKKPAARKRAPQPELVSEPVIVPEPVVAPEPEPVPAAKPAAEPIPIEQLIASTEQDRQPTKQEQIAQMAREGKNRVQIAEALEITMSEVDLILGLVGATQKA